MPRSERTGKFLKYVQSTLLLFLVAFLPCACGGGGATTGGTPTPPASQPNPVPAITSVSPSTITTLAVGSVITLMGSGFLSSSSVMWNSTTHPSTYVSATELQFTLLASDLAAVGSAQISVVNPAPGGGSASPTPIAIVYPVPAISSLNPAAVVAGSSSLILTVNGTGFSSSSVVQYNGVSRATTYVNPSVLTIAVTANDIANPTTAQITVVTGAPGAVHPRPRR